MLLGPSSRQITTHVYCTKTNTAHLISREWRLQTACRNCPLPPLSIRSMFFAARSQHFPRITFIKPIRSVITHFKMPSLRSGLTIRTSEPMHLERTNPPPEPLLDDSMTGEQFNHESVTTQPEEGNKSLTGDTGVEQGDAKPPGKQEEYSLTVPPRLVLCSVCDSGSSEQLPAKRLHFGQANRYLCRIRLPIPWRTKW
jgi:hypothetical protein